MFLAIAAANLGRTLICSESCFPLQCSQLMIPYQCPLFEIVHCGQLVACSLSASFLFCVCLNSMLFCFARYFAIPPSSGRHSLFLISAAQSGSTTRVRQFLASSVRAPTFLWGPIDITGYFGIHVEIPTRTIKVGLNANLPCYFRKIASGFPTCTGSDLFKKGGLFPLNIPNILSDGISAPIGPCFSWPQLRHIRSGDSMSLNRSAGFGVLSGVVDLLVSRTSGPHEAYPPAGESCSHRALAEEMGIAGTSPAGTWQRGSVAQGVPFSSSSGI